jgi:hypothetical protein
LTTFGTLATFDTTIAARSMPCFPPTTACQAPMSAARADATLPSRNATAT